MERLLNFAVLWILVVYVSYASGTMKFQKVSDHFFEDEPVNLSSVTWAHAVNSISLLEAALKDDTMMLEADVTMGVKEGTTKTIPIMAHPPNKTSDLSFQDFVDLVVKFVSNSSVKKGIKLDFKDINAVEPCMQILQNMSLSIKFPVWLNADILQGPVNSTTLPVDKDRFLNLTQTYFPNATLSLGWTTKYGCNNLGRYEVRHINEMIDLVSKNVSSEILEAFPPTFPLRAGLAAETEIDDILNLLGAIPSSTITLWSSENDPVDMGKLESLLEVVKNKVYIDLPFDLSNGTGVICDGKHHDENNENEDDNDKDEKDVTPQPQPQPDDNRPGSASLVNQSFSLVVLLTACFFVDRYF